MNPTKSDEFLIICFVSFAPYFSHQSSKAFFTQPSIIFLRLVILFLDQKHWKKSPSESNKTDFDVIVDLLEDSSGPDCKKTIRPRGCQDKKAWLKKKFNLKKFFKKFFLDLQWNASVKEQKKILNDLFRVEKNVGTG